MPKGLAVLSGALLMIPNLLGMPVGSATATLEFDAFVKDINKEVLWKHTYSGRNTKWVGLYYNNYSDDEDLAAVVQVELFKELLAGMKSDLQREVAVINGKLLSQVN